MSAATRLTGFTQARRDSTSLPIDAVQVEHVLIVFLCSAAVVPILFIGRAADTNSFTSWRWVFSAAGALRAEVVLFPAMLAAYAASRLSMRGRARYLVLAALPVLAVLPLWREPEAILDASRYFVQAKSLEEYGVGHFLREWGRGIDAWTDLPLVPFLYGLAFSALGESRTAIQALDTTLFASTVLLTWRIGRALWGDDAGLHAGILLLGIPYLLVQVPLLLVDVPTMFFLTLAVHALVSLARRGGALRTAACALALWAAALCKYSVAPMLLAAGAASVFAAPNGRRAAAARVGASVVVAAALAGALVAARPDVVARQVRLLGSYQWSGLGRWQEGFVSTFLFQTHPFITALALLGILRALRRRDARFLVAGWAALVAVPLGSARARYVLPLLPLVSLMASYGLMALSAALSAPEGRQRSLLVSSCIVATSMVIAWTAYLPFVARTSMANLKLAGERLDALAAPSVEVHVLPQRISSGSTFPAIPLLDYYTQKRIVSPQDWPAPSGDPGARVSSLRFSWEMRRPPFYPATPAEAAPVVVISGEPLARAPLAAPLRERERFDASTGVFRYQTVVTIYSRD